MLLTVDVNTVCDEGLNWPFFISCGCVWYCLKPQGSFLKFTQNIIIAAYFTIFEEGYSYKLFCKFFYKLIILLMIIDKFKKKMLGVELDKSKNLYKFVISISYKNIVK